MKTSPSADTLEILLDRIRKLSSRHIPGPHIQDGWNTTQQFAARPDRGIPNAPGVSSSAEDRIVPPGFESMLEGLNIPPLPGITMFPGTGNYGGGGGGSSFGVSPSFGVGGSSNIDSAGGVNSIRGLGVAGNDRYFPYPFAAIIVSAVSIGDDEYAYLCRRAFVPDNPDDVNDGKTTNWVIVPDSLDFIAFNSAERVGFGDSFIAAPIAPGVGVLVTKLRGNYYFSMSLVEGMCV